MADDDKLRRLESLFRSLREKWFYETVFSEAHERESESLERERRRNADNKACRREFDRETERLINGEPTGNDNG